MKGVQANQAAQVRMFAHDAIPVAIGAINPDNGITLDSGGYGYAVGDEITLSNGTGTGPVAAKLKVLSIGESKIINVQAVSGGKFYFNGVSAPTITLVEGRTYEFYQKLTSNTNHPLNLSTTSDGTHGGGSALGPSDGVVITGTAGSDRVLTYTVPVGAPTIYYYCATHSGMGGQINIQATGTDSVGTQSAVKTFEVIRDTTAKPFGKGYVVGNKVQAIEPNPPSAPGGFVGNIASIDLASTTERGACIYIGNKMATLTVKMESGELATFKNIQAGSFMPLLVTQITTATLDAGGAAGDNDVIALY